MGYQVFIIHPIPIFTSENNEGKNVILFSIDMDSGHGGASVASGSKVPRKKEV